MANRFAVATGTWASTSTWAATDGGAPGASVPTNVDDVFLTATSGAITVTIGAAAVCKSLTATGYTGTLTHNGFSLTVSGSVLLVAGMTYTPLTTSSVVFAASGTLTTGGKALPSITVNSTFTLTLGDNLTFAANVFMAVNLAGALNLAGFTLSGNSIINRVLLQSTVVGTARTVTVAGGTFAHADFMDIQFSNATNLDLSAITGKSGDCGGNSITGGGTTLTFTAPATQTWSGTSGGNWSANAWSGRVPLPQDNVVINAAFSASQTVTVDVIRLGASIDWTGATGSPTWANSVGVGASVFGGLTLIAGMAISGANGYSFFGRGNFTITSAGRTWTAALSIVAFGGTYTLQDALTCNASLTLLNGTLVSNNFTVTSSTFASNVGTTRAYTMGTSTHNLTTTNAATVWVLTTTTGMTLTATAATIVITAASANTRTFAGGGLSYGTLTYTVAGSTGQLTITGSNTFGTINFSDVTNARTLALTSGTTQTVGTFGVTGTAGKLMTLNATTPGTPATLSKASGTVSSDFLSIQDSTATGGAGWYAGTHSTNVSGNTGWVFTGVPTGTRVFGEGLLTA